MFFLIEFLTQAWGKRRVKLTTEFHNDLSWWGCFVEKFNSVPICDFEELKEWVTLFDAGDCICVASKTTEDLVMVYDNDENVVFYSKGNGEVMLYIPKNLGRDSAAREIICLWAYLMDFKQAYNMTITVVIFHRHTFLCLKKNRHKDVMVSMILRHVFWWSLSNNVKLEFKYDPIFH